MSQLFQFVPFGGVVLAGEGPPSSSLGVVGNLYIDRTNLLLYGPKSNAGWGTGLNLRAPSRWPNSITIRGAVAHNGTQPSNPENGDLYFFTSRGICSWLNNAAVNNGDAALFYNNSWTHIKWTSENLTLTRVDNTNQGEPDENERRGGFFLFTNSGPNSWGGQSRYLIQGSLAIYSGAEWYFNLAAPLNAVGIEGVGNPSNPPGNERIGAARQLNSGTLNQQWATGWLANTAPSLSKPSVAIFTSAGWVTLEPLLEYAGATVAGKVRLATQMQVNEGTDTETALTPATFRNYNPSSALSAGQSRPARIFYNTYNLVANSWTNVVHNLNNPYPTVTVYLGDEVILLDIERVDNNTVRIRSAVDLNGVVVSIAG